MGPLDVDQVENVRVRQALLRGESQAWLTVATAAHCRRTGSAS